ncbi:MAG: NTP transferase domain-containing protein [Muribaculaceae bacterium]|nr:NTP transferase domain-containing protein [Muribaculaceae bacterium]
MKAFVLAAGLGTRLRPFTLSHPKALVPVGGVPMLERVLDNLAVRGFDDVTINIHHFGEQILEHLSTHSVESRTYHISDERKELLDTGGAIYNARHLFEDDDAPVLVHNVDILSNADLRALFDYHVDKDNDMTLLVSERVSSRQLIFDERYRLKAWHHVAEHRYRPENYRPAPSDVSRAFSGIYVFSPRIFRHMESKGFRGKFSIIDYMLDSHSELKIEGFESKELQLIDIGKPDTLRKAEEMFRIS